MTQEHREILLAHLNESNVSFRSHLSGKAVSGKAINGKDLTTFKIGGPLHLLIEPQDATQTVAVFKALEKVPCSAAILGEGSNLLIPDAGITEPIIRPRGRELSIDREGLVTVDAGYPLMSLVRQVTDAGLAGLEFAGGIPGALGGAIFMNAGAHGSCMGNVTQWVEVATALGVERLPAASLNFQYRDSGLKKTLHTNGFLGTGAVVRAGLKLKRSDAGVTNALRAKYLAERRLRQPLQAACAGSIFKNPSAAVSAGALIERCGLKGLAVGGALVSPLHANWIINQERTATANDVNELISQMIKTVQEQMQIELHCELVRW